MEEVRRRRDSVALIGFPVTTLFSEVSLQNKVAKTPSEHSFIGHCFLCFESLKAVLLRSISLILDNIAVIRYSICNLFCIFLLSIKLIDRPASHFSHCVSLSWVGSKWILLIKMHHLISK